MDEAAVFRLLKKIREGPGNPVITEDEKKVIQGFSNYDNSRRRAPVPLEEDAPASVDEFMEKWNTDHRGRKHPFTKYHDVKEGARGAGWTVWPEKGIHLGKGTFGMVQLLYRSEDIDKAPERRRLAAMKVQPVDEMFYGMTYQWTELVVMKACHHKYIVDFYNAFFLLPSEKDKSSKQGKKRRRSSSSDSEKMVSKSNWVAADPKSRKKVKQHRSSDSESSDPTISLLTDLEESIPDEEHDSADSKCISLCIIMEYANAGNMMMEMFRYPHRSIPESGCRYYIRQICKGLQHMHGLGISHNDIHIGNILLVYRSDGKRKRCLIADFGLCKLPREKGRQPDMSHFQTDMGKTKLLLRQMLVGVTPDAPIDHLDQRTQHMLNHSTAMTMEQMLNWSWIREGDADAPDPETEHRKLMQPHELPQPAETQEPVAGPSGLQATPESSRARQKPHSR
jgi:serine/threonine protein kinase